MMTEYNTQRYFKGYFQIFLYQDSFFLISIFLPKARKTPKNKPMKVPTKEMTTVPAKP